MSDIAIKVESLGKSYFVGHNATNAESYTSLRDVISRNAKNLVRKTYDMFQGKAIVQGDEVEEFWALKDINFEIMRGDRVGIIGRNGAGKSTLLKILSRITEPTTGRIAINGRVASLLEVGTGFHPELTGRENIFLNGAILGMSRAEIRQKFDQIVDFAEIEKFLDTPVKRYSSGMYVRLAFSVAAHLDPDILIVDEVLAVGDAQFQKKCIGRMRCFGNDGRTVIFVSHNLAAIKSLTEKCIFLEKGTLVGFDDTEKVTREYICTKGDGVVIWKKEEILNLPVEIISWEIINFENPKVPEFDYRDPILLKIQYCVNLPASNINIAFNINYEDGNHVISTQDIDYNETLLSQRASGTYIATVKIPGHLLREGLYYGRISCGVAGGQSFEVIENIKFSVVNRSNIKTRKNRRGYIIPFAVWDTSLI